MKVMENKSNQAGDMNRTSSRKRSSSEAALDDDGSQRGEVTEKKVKTCAGEKRGGPKAGLDGEEECRATSKPIPQASLSGLPLEIKRMIFREALVADTPIQPVDGAKTKKRKSLPVPENIRCHKRRRLNLGVGLLGTAKWAYDLGADVLYKDNKIDFSNTEAGAMTIRNFRRRFSEQAKAKVQHVVIGARIIRTAPEEGLNKRRRSKLHRARKAADIKFATQLVGGSMLANVARTFPMLRSLEIRFNLKRWNPTRMVHWDLFGKDFQSLTVARPQSRADAVFLKSTKYNRRGEIIP